MGAGISGAILDATGKFKEMLRCIIVFICGTFVMFTLVNTPGHYTLVVVACSLIGFFCFAAMPVALELGVEVTYPVSEGTSAGFLWISGNLFGTISIFAMDAMRGGEKAVPVFNATGFETDDYFPDMVNASWLMCGFVGFGMCCGWFINSPYYRQEAERAAVEKAEDVPIPKTSVNRD